jgi:hypothetical protein
LRPPPFLLNQLPLRSPLFQPGLVGMELEKMGLLLKLIKFTDWALVDRHIHMSVERVVVHQRDVCVMDFGGDGKTVAKTIRALNIEDKLKEN